MIGAARAAEYSALRRVGYHEAMAPWRALPLLWLVACGQAGGGGPDCVPTAAGFGGVCASFIKCPDEAPICVTVNHMETYGFCTMTCSDLFDCLSDAGVTACGAEIIDVPGVDGSVRGCSFDCSASGCPAGFTCLTPLNICFPLQDAAWPDAALRCSPDAA